MRRIVAALATLAALAVTTACSPPPDIAVRNAWVRAVPPGSSATAGYLVLENRGRTERILTGVSAGGVGRVEMHSSGMEDGVMRMRRLEEIAVPAGGEVALAPGGLHLMLFGDPLPAAGSTVSLQLEFADGTTLTAAAPVRRGGN